jgi:hypothetical protein
VDVWHIARVCLRRVLLLFAKRWRDVARFLHIRLPNDLASEIQRIAARGVLTTIVFARGEPGIELLRIQGGPSLQRLGDRCRVHIIEGADHTFSRSASRTVLERVLSEALFTRQAAATGAAEMPPGL